MVVGSPGLGLRFPGSRFGIRPSYRRRGRLPFPASVPASPAGRARGDSADGGHPAGLAAPRPELTHGPKATPTPEFPHFASSANN